MSKTGDQEGVVSLSRGLHILRAFGEAEGALGIQQIAEATALPKATVSRLVYTLMREEYLIRAESEQRYQLGYKVFGIGRALLSSLDVCAVARPIMARLADTHDATIDLAVRERDSALLIESVASPRAAQIQLPIGSKVPLATSSMGRTYFAFLQPDELKNELQELKQSLPDGAQIVKSIRDGLNEARKDGFSVFVDEWRTGVVSVSVPLQLAPKDTLLLLNCSVPARRVTRGVLLDVIGPALVAASNEILIELRRRKKTFQGD
ncbi:MAG: IclR family transcriptional regulator [Parvibaculum sp.]|uniref:IclR family transcriptional regulator n=1 Tax=Parvibaculum sp. TaxID=2024848 RepID=UPI003C749D77